MTRAALQDRLTHWRLEGEKLAGSLFQLTQRASVYRHIYRASGGNHIFPLIAAHGALWARGYFRWALDLGRKLSWHTVLDRPDDDGGQRGATISRYGVRYWPTIVLIDQQGKVVGPVEKEHLEPAIRKLLEKP